MLVRNFQSSERRGRPRFSRDGLARFLRAAFPHATAKQVEHATGVSASTVDNWLREATAPTADHMAVLFAVFGPAILAVAWPVTRHWPVATGADHERIKAAIA